MKKKATKTKKDSTSVLTKADIGSGLKLTEEAFCQAYVSHDRNLYGNGVQCYLEIYGPEYTEGNGKPMSYMVAAVLANRLLNKVKIVNRINELLEEGGFNDSNVDKQHLFLLNQHADLKSKLGAIKEYNSLKKRIDNSGVVVVVDPTKKESLNKALEFLHGRNREDIKE